MLAGFFSMNRKGRLNKCCNNCLMRFRCQRCDYKCSRNSDLKKHIKRVHDKIKDRQCPHCEYKCSTNSDLKKHIKQVHDMVRDIQCSQCNFKCSAISSLRRHMKAVHDKLKNAQCPNCVFKCSDYGNLQSHIKQVHTQLKDFECLQCNFKCSLKASLVVHIKRIHDKLKDFECSQCEYKCPAKGDLDKHTSICSGVSNLSSGEFKIKEVLDRMLVNYQRNSSYKVKSIKGRWLLWDFIIEADGEPLFIEFDGRQHFQAVPRWGGVEGLAMVQQRDKIKNDFCDEHGLLLLRIPYTQYENIEALVVNFIRAHTTWGFE